MIPVRRFSYGRRGVLLAQDALLAAVFVALMMWNPEGTLGAIASALRVAIPLVLAWGILTLHFPCVVEVDDRSLAFHRYGRTHRFDLRHIETIRVRRFAVRDRVLVRIVPAPSWRGRYWLLRDLDGFDDLVRLLENLPKQRVD